MIHFTGNVDRFIILNGIQLFDFPDNILGNLGDILAVLGLNRCFFFRNSDMAPISTMVVSSEVSWMVVMRTPMLRTTPRKSSRMMMSPMLY